MIHILTTLLSHWRRHPMQLVALLVGLTIATALWSGVQALNAQARDSYDKAAQLLGGDGVESLALINGARFSDKAFAELRRAGWIVSPVLEGDVRVKGRSLRVIGIDPLSLPPATALATPTTGAESAENGEGFQNFLTPPWQSLIAPSTIEQLGLDTITPTVTETGVTLPAITAAENVTPGILVMDIGAAQSVLGAVGELSRLLIDPDAKVSATSLEDATSIPLQRTSESEVSGDLNRLTDSFHLNLTAFGMLAFLVGLFIVYSAITLAFEQRLPMLRTLRACGVSALTLTMALLLELLTLAFIGGITGVALGYLIAVALMPDVATSLGGLYGARVSGSLALSPSWWSVGLGMSMIGALAASSYSLAKAYWMPPLATAQRFAWREAQERWLNWQSGIALGLLVLATILHLFGNGLVVGFAILAALLVAGALALPPLLSVILRAGESRASGPVSQWFWADSRMQLSGLSVALMAMLLALAANIGVGTMVDGFRKTFNDWLDQRLVAEIYLDSLDETRVDAVMSWLDLREDVTVLLPKNRVDVRIEGWPVSVLGFVDHASYRDYWPMKAANSDLWDAVLSDEAVLVSEQLAQRLTLRLDDTLSIGEWRPRIVGIYPDYGNPKGQISANIDTVTHYFPDAGPGGIGVRTDDDNIELLMEALRTQFNFTGSEMIDQASLKAFSKGIFEKTFAVTAALNVLTMLVAGVAMFMSLLTLSEMRLPQLAPLWAGGLTRRKLALLELSKTLALALFTALLAVPLGLAVAWCLIAVVNVQAFGWRLPFHVFPYQWLWLIALAILTAFFASLMPTLCLRTIAPMRLLRVFANER